MMAGTHLLGSERGYSHLAASPDVSPAERAAITGLDVGLPAGGRAERLEEYLVVVCRPLPSGRVALTRCVAGGIDDVGRRTIQFRTLIFNLSEWVLETRHELPRLLTTPAIWKNQAFEQGAPLAVSTDVFDRSPPSQSALALACMVRDGPRPVLLRADAATNGVLMSMVSRLSDADAGELRWGLGLGRVIPDMDVLTVGVGASAIGQPLRQIDQSLAEGCGACGIVTLPPLREADPSACESSPPSDRSRTILAPSSNNRVMAVVWLVLLVMVGGLACYWWWGGSWWPTRQAIHQSETLTVVSVPKPIAAPKLAPPDIGAAYDQPQSQELPPSLPSPEPPVLPTSTKALEPTPGSSVEQPLQPIASVPPPPQRPLVPEDPAEVAELLNQLHRSVLDTLLPEGATCSDTPSRAVMSAYIQEHVSSVWDPGAGKEDALAYLCIFAQVDAKFETITSLIDEEGVKYWGSRPATERWLRAAGRNERQIGRRMRALDRCADMVRRIGQMADVLRETVNRDDFDAVRDFVVRKWFAAGYADVMKQDWRCIEQARHLIDERLGKDWPGDSAIMRIAVSRDVLKARRDGDPGQGDR